MHNIRTLMLIVIVGVPSYFNIAACTTERNSTLTKQKYTLFHNGIERSYVIRNSHQFQLKNLVPLVLVLHGGGGNASNAERMTGFTRKAIAENFIVVYPEGIGRIGTWNAGHCCSYAMKNHINDIGFIDALIDKLIENYPVDPNNIFVTGMSNGGMMAHTLGRELSHKIAGIAPVVAGLHGDERAPPMSVPTIIINGALDQNVPPQGGQLKRKRATDGTLFKPSEYQGEFWANANSCTTISSELPSTPMNTVHKYIISRQYSCPNNQDVVQLMVLDNGHAWPSGKKGSNRGDTPSTSLNATDVIWDFFEAHTK